MERATHPADSHADAHPAPDLAPMARDPDLPALSDSALMLFAGVALLVTALALLFASYHLFVRYTFIGEVLNGVRHRRQQRGDTPADAGPAVHVSGESLAVLTDARKHFGKVKALDGLSLDVRAGELLAVLGPNGAGKSTAISLLLGLLEPDSGTATLFGQPPRNVEARAHR